MQNSFARTTFAVAACVLVGASVASAQATRTWVSGVGDDANPCSRTAPCKTFAGAISRTAPQGEISVLDPGGYGAVTITKAITINGEGTYGSILSPSSSAIIINITDPAQNGAVTLKNLTLNGANLGLTGIRYMSAAALIVDNVHVFGFHTGIEVSAGGNATVSNSRFSNNRQFGAHGMGGTLTIEHSTFATNNVAIQSTNPGTVRLSNNSFYNNLTGFGCGGGLLMSDGMNRKAGNAGGGVPTCDPTVAITLQ